MFFADNGGREKTAGAEGHEMYVVHTGEVAGLQWQEDPAYTAGNNNTERGGRQKGGKTKAEALRRSEEVRSKNRLSRA